MVSQALNGGNGHKFIQYSITEIVGEGEDLNQNGICLETVGFHLNGYLGTTEKHRCKK